MTTNYEFRHVELVGLNGPSVEDDLNEFGRQGYRLISYDIGKHIAVFERPVEVTEASNG